MTASPFDLSMSLARIWVDTSLQVMRASTEVWTGLLSAGRPSTTASPWWMPPQSAPARTPAALPWPSPFGVGTWMPPWPMAIAPQAPSSATANPFSWPMGLPSASNGNPFAPWQKMWLQAAAPQLAWPWQTATEPRTPADVWQPFAAAYRTANGHAMAAILRTMADVVQPKPQSFSPAQFWPSALPTRH